MYALLGFVPVTGAEDGQLHDAVAEWIRQCGSDRSAKTSGANSPSASDPVSRNRIRFVTTALVAGRPCLPTISVAGLVFICVLMPGLLLR
jgi:hypothetical protein